MASYDDTILAETSLVHYWKLNEAVGSGTVADSKGAATGTVGSGVTLGVAGIYADGETVASFDGSANAEINIGEGGRSDTAWSVELQGYMTADPGATECGFVLLSDNQYGTVAYNYPIGGGNGRPQCSRVFNLNTSINTVGTSGTTYIAVNTPFHLVVTVAGVSAAARNVYLNGALADSNTGSWNTIVGVSKISYTYNLSGFSMGTIVRMSGKIGKVAYYNAALDATQVSTHYTAATTPLGGLLSNDLSGFGPGLGRPLSGGFLARAARRVFDMLPRPGEVWKPTLWTPEGEHVLV